MSPASSLLYPLLSMIISAALALSVWYWLGRPLPLAEPPVTSSLRCLSYTHFREGQSPFDADTAERLVTAHIEEDLRLLSGITSCIRLYATLGMEPVLRIAGKYGIQVLLGAWVSRDEAATRREIETLVKLADSHPQTIRAVLVGNEALLRHEIEADRLAELIEEVRHRVDQPVSYADVWEFQLRYPQVAEASDFVTIHILPYWEDEPVAIDDAVEHTRRIRQQLVERFPDKPVLIGETGWPTLGRMREGALPSRVNAARYIRGFAAAAHSEAWDYNFIEAFDQPWKRSLEGAVGGYWGLFDTARHDKLLLKGEVSNHPRWLGFGMAAIALCCLIVPLLRPPLKVAPLLALVAAGWTLQLEQLLPIVRNGLETAGALLLLAITLAASLAGLARLAGRPFAPRPEAHVLLGLGAVACVFSLWLTFDPRYRDFFVAGFIAPTLLQLLSLRTPKPVVREGREEIAIGLLLSLLAIVIAVSETWLNHQAIVWSLVSLTLGSALAHRGLQATRRLGSQPVN